MEILFRSLLLLTTLFITTLSTPTPSQLYPRVIPNAGWSVKSFTRGTYPIFSFFHNPKLTFADCTGIYSVPACIYEFEISAGGGRLAFGCYVVDYTPDPIHSSFYSFPCNAHAGVDGGRVVSWGYNADFDFAVVSLEKFRGRDR